MSTSRMLTYYRIYCFAWIVASIVLLFLDYGLATLNGLLTGNYHVTVLTNHFDEHFAEVFGLATAAPGIVKELVQDLRDVYNGEW